MSNQNSESNPRAKHRGVKTSPPLLIVLSGPSGVGKDAVLSRLRRSDRPFHYVVTATTRPKRAREKKGVSYHFLSQKAFQQMIDRHQFLEWASVYGNYYGVPKDDVISALSKGVDTIVKVDVQGAAAIKRIFPQAVFIFLMPPSAQALEKRLKGRRSESSEDLALRLATATEELTALPIFDYVVTSHQNKLDEVVSKIDSIIAAEKCRAKPRIVQL